MLIFNDGSWTVATAGYTVASKNKSGIIICYPWSGLSGISAWGDMATGVARIEIEMTMEKFLQIAQRSSGHIDLRPHQN